MFKHYLDRSPDPEDPSIGGDIRIWRFVFDWEDILVFCHLTLAFAFVVWGLEILLPWSIWRILVGIYMASWAGKDLIKQLWGKGIYFLNSPDTS